MPGELRAEVVEREDVPVMFKRANDEQSAITAAWTELEQAVGSFSKSAGGAGAMDR